MALTRRTPLKRTPFKRKPIAKKETDPDAPKKKVVRKKKSDKRKLIEKLDKIFSIYIRLRDAMPHSGYVKCITCGKILHWKESQACHYIGRANMALRFSEVNVHAGCMPCNVFLHGNMLAYRRWMVKQYGEKIVDNLELRGNIEVKKWSEWELEETIKYYTALVEKIKSDKGL
ncbi:MAG: recombination protein NinG [Prevotella sp.]|nr:recombination protein NinG [Candidatus Prevotella equi]